jgi:hypothetical protein
MVRRQFFFRQGLWSFYLIGALSLCHFSPIYAAANPKKKFEIKVQHLSQKDQRDREEKIRTALGWPKTATISIHPVTGFLLSAVRNDLFANDVGAEPDLEAAALKTLSKVASHLGVSGKVPPLKDIADMKFGGPPGETLLKVKLKCADPYIRVKPSALDHPLAFQLEFHDEEVIAIRLRAEYPFPPRSDARMADLADTDFPDWSDSKITDAFTGLEVKLGKSKVEFKDFAEAKAKLSEIPSLWFEMDGEGRQTLRPGFYDEYTLRYLWLFPVEVQKGLTLYLKVSMTGKYLGYLNTVFIN